MGAIVHSVSVQLFLFIQNEQMRCDTAAITRTSPIQPIPDWSIQKKKNRNSNHFVKTTTKRISHCHTSRAQSLILVLSLVSCFSNLTHLGCEFSSYMRSLPSLNKLMVCLVFLVRFSINTRKYSLSPRVSILPS